MYAAPFTASLYDGPPSGAAGGSVTHPWKDGEFSFHDVLDTLNPLQHLPVIGTIYRWITGDKPGDIARVFGDGLYGGPVGFATGMLSVAVKDNTGKDPGEIAMSLLTGDNAQVKLGAAASVPAGGATPPAAAATAAPAASAATAAAAAPATVAATPATAANAAVPSPIIAPRAPMMSLFKTAPSAAPAPGTTSPAEQAFLGQNSALQHSVYGNTAPPPVHAAVPLQLNGPQLPQRFPRPAPSAPSPAIPGNGANAATPTPDLSALPQNAPVDIPQRMMEALDKYAHIQQQPQRGQQVDVAQ